MPEDVDRLLSALREALEQELSEGLTTLALFGSFARGDWHARSDLDVLVIGRALPRRMAERQELFQRAAAQARSRCRVDDLGTVEWSPVLKTEEEARHHSPLYLDMTEEVRLLYDRGGFFAGVLEGLRSRLRQAGSRRYSLPDGSWYWDLKPAFRFGEVVEI